MRILLTTDSRDPSGIGWHMLALAAGLAVDHWPALVFPEAGDGPAFAARAKAMGLEAHTADAEAFGVVLTEFAPDLLHVHAGIGWEAQGLCALGRAAGVPVVRTEHLPWLITDPTQEMDYARAAACVDAFVAVSAASAQSWAPVLQRLQPRALLATIQNGVAPRLATRLRAEVRAELGLDDTEALILCIARFTLQKDHASLIAAFGALRARHPKTRLALVGEGPERGSCEALARAIGGIAFLGGREDIGDLLAAADLLVLPSRFEGLPLIVIEAMAARLPVVATRIGGTVEALGETHPFLCTPSDPVALAACLAVALDDPPVARASADAAQVRYQSHLTAERMTAETLGLYCALLRRTPRLGGIRHG